MSKTSSSLDPSISSQWLDFMVILVCFSSVILYLLMTKVYVIYIDVRDSSHM